MQQIGELRAKSKFDLEERTAVFGESVIRLCLSIPQTAITKRIIDQVIGSATSIGANYMEANGAASKKDFRNKIFIVKKECQETKHHLRMLSAAVPEKRPMIRLLWQECHELTLIFQKISSSLTQSLSEN